MTNEEMFSKRMVLFNIPMMLGDESLSPKLQARLMLMRVAYDKGVAAFEDDMKAVVKELKKEGFDERSQKMQRLEEIDGKEDATAEEKKEAEGLRKEKPAYDKEMEELNKGYMEARSLKMSEKSEMPERMLSMDEFTEIIQMIKMYGDIEIQFGDGPKQTMTRENFIGFIASMLVKE